MKKNLSFLILLLPFVILNACSDHKKNVSLKSSHMTPKVFKIGTDSVLTASIEVSDLEKTIGAIEFSFPEIPPAPKVMLNDDGKNGDLKKDDHIWSANIPLPPKSNMPHGEFKVQFKAIGKDNLIMKQSNSEQELIATTSITFSDK